MIIFQRLKFIIQWDSTANAGFTTGDPWMRVNVDYGTWNAKAQIDDPYSVHSFLKKALSVHKHHKILVGCTFYSVNFSRSGRQYQIYGDFEDLSEGQDKIFVFTRASESARALILLNFSEKEETFSIPLRILETTMTLVLGNYDEQGAISIASGNEILLRPYEGRLYVNGT
jgi:oligo-1,6-glucosidase